MTSAVPYEPRRSLVALEAPSWPGTLIFLAGLVFTGFTLHGDSPSESARYAAVGTGVSLLLLVLIEVMRNWGSLLRVDIVCLLTLYYLLFVEFLFPQSRFDSIANGVPAVEYAIEVVLCSLGALVIGRHFTGRREKQWRLATMRLPPSSLLFLFWLFFAIGYFYMLASVSFNPGEMVAYFLEPRFSAPWQRGRFGDADALLYELGATIYLVPPLAGLIIARRENYSRVRVISVVLALLFTLFYGFTAGTRSIMGTYLITFLVAYFYSSTSLRKEIFPMVALSAVIMLASTVYGIEFRTVGLRAYVGRTEVTSAPVDKPFYVDYNLYTISELVAVFPESEAYLGWHVPAWFAVRVVPRALWPGKPDGDVISPERYLAVPAGTTISATFIGEGYMCAGLAGAVFLSFAVGSLGTWWTRRAFIGGSDFGVLLYGSGFFAVVTTMRSIYMLPVALMPTLALVLLGYGLLRQQPATLAEDASFAG